MQEEEVQGGARTCILRRFCGRLDSSGPLCHVRTWRGKGLRALDHMFREGSLSEFGLRTGKSQSIPRSDSPSHSLSPMRISAPLESVC